jgi:hypothetical protein
MTGAVWGAGSLEKAMVSAFFICLFEEVRAIGKKVRMAL